MGKIQGLEVEMRRMKEREEQARQQKALEVDQEFRDLKSQFGVGQETHRG